MIINKIAIVFGDNDFCNTFYCVLNTILESTRYSGPLPFSKEQLCEVINSISYGHYLLFQNRKDFERTKESWEDYFKIYSNKIRYEVKQWSQWKPYLLINEEVEQYLLSDTFWNGESFFLYVEEELVFSR